MLEILSHRFIVLAFIVGFLCSIVSAIMGNFLVANRQSVLTETLVHTSLAGVAIGVFLHSSPYFFALYTTFISSILIFFLNKSRKIPADALNMLFLVGGISLAILFTHLAQDNTFSLSTFLFGSILTITVTEVIHFSIMSAILLILIALFWNRFLSVTFELDSFSRSQHHGEFFRLLLTLMLGGLITFSLKIIGGLLISALLIISVITAQLFARSFLSSVGWSIFFNIIGVNCGIISSIYFDIPTSSAIALCLILLYFLTFFGVKIKESFV